uniref:Uncharacterized protein n=1 Tax=Glossina brevipalpis TaxID=37001 RepID=A0A1A9WSM7_9MUSC
MFVQTYDLTKLYTYEKITKMFVQTYDLTIFIQFFHSRSTKSNNLDSDNLGILGSWGVGLLGSWALGGLGFWRVGLLGILDSWGVGLLGSWALGELNSWEVGLLGSLVLGFLGLRLLGYFSCLHDINYDTLKYFEDSVKTINKPMKYLLNGE